MDIKRTILWVVFAMSLLLLWSNWMQHNGQTSLFYPIPEGNSPTSKDNSVPHVTAAASAAGNPTEIASDTTPRGQLLTITTDVYKLQIDTMGGVIRHLELLQFNKERDSEDNVVLFEDDAKHTYLAQSGLTSGLANLDYPNHKTLFTVAPGPLDMGHDKQLKVVLSAVENGVKLVRTYVFKRDSYVIGVDNAVTNQNEDPIHPALYLQIVHDGTKPTQGSWLTHNAQFYTPAVYTDKDKFQKLSFEKIDEGSAEHAKHASNGWIALIQHFFVSAFIPQEGAERDIYTRKLAPNLFAIGTIAPLGTIAPGATKVADARLYAGPQTSRILETIAPGLELVKDYGLLTIIAAPMFWAMDNIHKFLGNWGWTIIFFTLLIKLILFPLSAASYRSMAKMKLLTPKMQSIRERYKDEPQKMSQAMMELYKTEKANPLGGCLPILVQMPIFISLYWVLQGSVEMRGAPWLGWIHDLSSPDPYFILPVMMAATMFIQQKLSPAPPDPLQAKMMMIMPLVFSVMFFFFPSGLVLYYVVNNLLSIAQQWVITHKIIGNKA